MSSASIQNGLLNLFPAPKPFSSVDLPASIPSPGVSPESTAALREALQDDYKRWHCFFNDHGFHNHSIHGILALWHLGADADTIKASYAKTSSYQRPTFASPGPITRDNWTDHLGDEKYYDAYLVFFTGELAVKGPSAILEDYVFSSAANYPEGDKKVQMLNRFMDGVLHPIIHCGQGYEFGIPGVIAEGLAQAAVHPGDSDLVIPASWWKVSENKTHSSTTSSPLSVLSRILGDPEMIWEEHIGDELMYRAVLERHSSQILKHFNAWQYNKEDLPRVLEEIAWVVTLMYAVAGYPKKDTDTFNADFFCMHFVNSSLFLPSIAAHLKPTSQELLFRSYLTVISGWFLARGKPDLDIKAFFADNKTIKSLMTTTPTHEGPSYALPDTSKASPNPWTEIIHLAILHPDEHVRKLQRTMMQYAQTYGTREAGYFKDVELKDADKLDGTLFVRAANLSALRLKQPPMSIEVCGRAFDMYWDQRGFFQK